MRAVVSVFKYALESLVDFSKVVGSLVFTLHWFRPRLVLYSLCEHELHLEDFGFSFVSPLGRSLARLPLALCSSSCHGVIVKTFACISAHAPFPGRLSSLGYRPARFSGSHS